MKKWEEKIKIKINEKEKGKKKSKIEEYVEYYGGEGVKKIEIKKKEIISEIRKLSESGKELIKVNEKYYEIIREKINEDKVKMIEEMEILKEMKIIVEYDEGGYMMKILKKKMKDRKNILIEVIKRKNKNGFGEGNLKEIFEDIEEEKDKSGNL
jgi:4-hydroxyphenylpyruvate dioxygenase